MKRIMNIALILMFLAGCISASMADTTIYGGSLPTAGGTVTGTVNMSGLTASSPVETDASKNITSATKTGTGSTYVMQTGPTLTTPNIGAATATTVNKLTLTAPANGSTLTIADGKTLTVSDTLALALGTANLKYFMNAAGNNTEWANGYKIGTFDYDTATASGTHAITGVGFAPSMVIFLAAIDSTSQMSIGVATSAANYCISDYGAAAAGQWAVGSLDCIYLYQSATITTNGSVTTWGTNGFTLTFTKSGSKTGTARIYYIAFR